METITTTLNLLVEYSGELFLCALLLVFLVTLFMSCYQAVLALRKPKKGE